MTRSLATLVLAIAASANAQPECPHRWKPWQPQRTGLFFAKDQPDHPVQTVRVAGEVATTLMFPGEVDGGQTRLIGGDGRFEPLMIGGRSVVLVPLRDLAFDESFSLLVTLRDGTAIPFSLRAPRRDESSDGQVDVYLDREDIPAVRQALQLVRSRVEELSAENDRHVQEALSVDHALATLLVEGKMELTPFVVANRKMLQDDGVELKVITFRRRDRKIDSGKAAIVISVTNQDPKRPWDLDEVRLMSATTGDMKAFASRASAPSIKPGDTGVVAVVMGMDVFGTGAESDHLILELWRARPVARQAAIELVAVADSDIPVRIRGSAKSR
jgi:uncharacterized protein (TIGR02268 family)